jgi:hypothetical protein
MSRAVAAPSTASTETAVGRSMVFGRIVDSAVADSVRTRRTAASVSMNPIRSRGWRGSIGRYAPPALITARIAMIISSDRGSITATIVSGPTPRSISTRASREDS